MKYMNGVMPDNPDRADSANADYWHGMNSLLHARWYKHDRARLAANACCAMANVAQARARNVWLADDPEAARIQREEDAFWAIDRELPADAPPANPPAYFNELETPAHGRYYNAPFPYSAPMGGGWQLARRHARVSGAASSSPPQMRSDAS